MQQCLNDEQVEAYVSGQLSPEDDLRLNEHISSCERCKSAVFARPAILAASATTFGGLEMAREACPSEELLIQYAEGKLNARRTTRLQMHLARCGRCREVADVLRRLATQEVARLPASSCARRYGLMALAATACAAAVVAAIVLYGPQQQGHLPIAAKAPAPAAKHVPQRQVAQGAAHPTVTGKPPQAKSAPERFAVRTVPPRQKPVTVTVVTTSSPAKRSEVDAAVADVIKKQVEKTRPLVLADARTAMSLEEQIEEPIVRGGETPPKVDLSKLVASADAAVDRVVVWKVTARGDSQEAGPSRPPGLTYPCKVEISIWVVDKSTGKILYRRAVTGTIAGRHELRTTVRALIGRSVADAVKG